MIEQMAEATVETTVHGTEIVEAGKQETMSEREAARVAARGTTGSILRTGRNSWRWLLMALPLVGLLGGSVAQAGRGGEDGHGPGGPMGEMGAFRMHKLLKVAGATDAQKTQIKATWDGLRPQLQALRESRMKLHEQMQQALTATTIDAAGVERLRQESVKLAEQSSALVTKGMVASAQILTPEQRQKIATELAQHHRPDHAQ